MLCGVPSTVRAGVSGATTMFARILMHPLRARAPRAGLPLLAVLLSGLASCGGGGGGAADLPVTVTVSPASASVQAPGGTQAFSAAVANATNSAVTWQVGGVSGGNATLGTISGAGLYSAPAAVPSPAQVTVTAVAVADPTRSGTATVTLTPAPVTVTVAPTTASVAINATYLFTATVTHAADTSVSWSVNGTAGGNATVGTVSASGTYTAPATVPSPAQVTLTATSTADPQKSASATVTVTAGGGIGVSVSPRRSAVTTQVPQQFTATVTGSTNTAVSWSVDGVDGGSSATGTISASGLYTPPTAPGTHVVAATSLADGSRSASASVAVTDLAGVATQRYAADRSGLNPSEYALTPALLVTAGAFGKLFSCAVDGPIYAQPLWVANLAIGGGTHNVVFVVTQAATVYAFDADAAPCHQYWKTSLLPAGETPVPAADTGETGDVPGEFGITGTPVIDLASGTLYAVATSKASGPVYYYRLHSLALASGAENANSPAVAAATVDGITFDPRSHMQRPGLLLSGNTVYIAFGSHGDLLPYSGWLLGYDATTLVRNAAFNTAPHGTRGSVWMVGTGPAADSAGNIYLSTANGTFDAASALTPNDDYGDSMLRLAPGAGLTVADYFTPSNQATLEGADWDFGTSGVVLLPDALGSAAHPHLALGGDKESKIFLVDRDNMGHYTTGGPDRNLQTLLVNNTGSCITCGLFTTPSVWNGNLYVGAINDTLRAYPIANASIALQPSSQSPETYAYPGTNPVISAAGTSAAVVWTVDTTANGTTTPGSTPSGPAILRAYDAGNLATRLWSSNATGADAAGQAVKFVVPTVANGHVYVGCQAELTVYGLQP
jgi:hypothetical protein